MVTDRRTRFRDYMRRLDPTGEPAQAIASGFYVAPPNAVSQRIATRIELQPASSHLLVGGIGSGKTTELIAIERRLAAVGDLLPIRVDVPSRHRLEKMKPGVLIALAATEASAQLSREREQGLALDESLDDVVHRISRVARGYWIDYPDFDPFDNDGYWVPGILEEPQLSQNVQTLSEALGRVNAVLQKKPVLLLDGLDRVPDIKALAAVLGQDVPAITRAGVGLVIIGPQLLRFSPYRAIEGVFETVHLHGATGADTAEGQAFLTAVLRARADEELLPADSAAGLVRWSGGVLRDLVALGRAAGADAYAAGSDTVQPAHVDAASDRFGRDLLLGCTREMVARLKELVPRRHAPRPPGPPRRDDLPAFTVATEIDQRLLIERLIIEIPGTPIRYVPHPTIVPLIAGLGGS